MPKTNFRKIQEGREKQYLRNGEIHNWYRFVFAYPDHLVTELLERFNAQEGQYLLDPFCGTGTTLIEGMKLGLNCIGIEANPACVLASKVKTNWSLSVPDLLDALEIVVNSSKPLIDLLETDLNEDEIRKVDELKKELLEDSPEGRYFVSSKMLQRRWISELPFYKILIILQNIKKLKTKIGIKEALLLALVAILVEDVGNIKFGPELYVTGDNSNVDVMGLFKARVKNISQDLIKINLEKKKSSSIVIQGDARDCEKLLRENGVNNIDLVITSPPYPAEKDYSRQTRLELVFLGYVYDRESLQSVKKAMIRSNTKGIYKSDNDSKIVRNIPEILKITNELNKKTAKRTDGFSQLYSKVIEEYFGGMFFHLKSLYSVLATNGICAYVVGDQRTYLQTHVPTGEILKILAEKIGYDVEEMLIWRVRRGTSGSKKEIDEQILILRKPNL